MNPILRYTVDLLGRGAFEFIWFLASFVLGAGIVASLGEDYLGALPWAVLVMFNAAVIRVALPDLFDWLGKRLDQNQEDRQAIMDNVKIGLRMAVNSGVGDDTQED